MMKNLVFFILLLCLSFNLFAQGGERIYKDFGIWELKDGNNKIAISAYITVENAIKNKKNDGVNKLLYNFYLLSQSIYNNDTTRTWLYGTKIFVDGVEITSTQFPEGFTIAVPTKPIKIYWYESEKKDINFSITWEKSIYDPRIRK